MSTTPRAWICIYDIIYSVHLGVHIGYTKSETAQSESSCDLRLSNRDIRYKNILPFARTNQFLRENMQQSLVADGIDRPMSNQVEQCARLSPASTDCYSGQVPLEEGRVLVKARDVAKEPR